MSGKEVGYYVNPKVFANIRSGSHSNDAIPISKSTLFPHLRVRIRKYNPQ